MTVESVDGRCGIEGTDVDVLVVVEVVVGCDAVGTDVDCDKDTPAPARSQGFGGEACAMLEAVVICAAVVSALSVVLSHGVVYCVYSASDFGKC